LLSQGRGLQHVDRLGDRLAQVIRRPFAGEEIGDQAHRVSSRGVGSHRVGSRWFGDGHVGFLSLAWLACVAWLPPSSDCSDSSATFCPLVTTVSLLACVGQEDSGNYRRPMFSVPTIGGRLAFT
jgi:hypothetical protein